MQLDTVQGGRKWRAHPASGSMQAARLMSSSHSTGPSACRSGASGGPGGSSCGASASGSASANASGASGACMQIQSVSKPATRESI